MLFSFCHVTLSSFIAVMPLGTAGIWTFNCDSYSLGQKHILGSFIPSIYHAVPAQLNPRSKAHSHAAWLYTHDHSASTGCRLPRRPTPLTLLLFYMTAACSPSLLQPPSFPPPRSPIFLFQWENWGTHRWPYKPAPIAPVYLLAPMLTDATFFFICVDELSSLHPRPSLPVGKNFDPSLSIPSKSSLFLLYQHIFSLCWIFLNINMLLFLLSKNKNCLSPYLPLNQDPTSWLIWNANKNDNKVLTHTS